MARLRLLGAAAMAGAVGMALTGVDARVTLDIQPASRILVNVGKAGAFSFAGHAHTVEAPVTGHVLLDPADFTRSEVTLRFETSAMRVSGEGEPPKDVPEVQRVMLSNRVLDVGRYPAIVFRSQRVSVANVTGSRVSLSVDGELTLHGVTRHCLVPVRVDWHGKSLLAEGTTTIRQSDFGIEPVRAAGGAVRVKDVLDIAFTIHAAGR